MMEDKYIKFYKTFDKRFKSNNNLILCSKTLSDGRMILYVTILLKNNSSFELLFNRS